MSYDAGRIEPQFVYPGEAAPNGARFADANVQPSVPTPFARGDHRRHRGRQVAAARRASRLRRLLPLTIATLAAVVFIMLTEGGQHARQAVPVAVYLDQILGKLGLGLSEVTVEGQRMTRDGEIYAKLQLDKRYSIWLFDTAAARQRVETLPWVQKASLKRIFPDRLHVAIRERVPIATWNDGLRTMLLDADGRVLGVASAEQFPALPQVFGAGAAGQVTKMLRVVERFPALNAQVGLYEWRATRRWTLHLKSGQQIHLPAIGIGAALIQLTKGRQGQQLLDTSFEMLDLRLKDEIAVRMRK